MILEDSLKIKIKSIAVLFSQHAKKRFSYSMLIIYLKTETFSMHIFAFLRIFLLEL